MNTPPARFGLGFRTQHFAELQAAPREVDWIEVLSDSYLTAGGPRRAMLEQLRREYPIALHGVSLGIANERLPDASYLARLRALADSIEPAFVSDHLCWTGTYARNSHDLLPIAYTHEVLALVAERVELVQEALGRRLLLENASAYVAFRADELGEADFFAALCGRTGCGMLLDVNNLFVNAQNLGVGTQRFLDALKAEHIGYLHVAGHAVLADVRIDTHGADVPPDVWSLFAEAARRFPHAHVILERDDEIPPLAELTRELAQARLTWHEAVDGSPGSEPAALLAPLDAPQRASLAPDWHTLQRELWTRLIDRPRGFDHESVSGLRDLLESTHPVAAARGLRVYSDAYTATMQRALATNFPTLARVLSARDFAALAASYVAAHPSESHDYVRLGARLAEFVRGFSFRDPYEIANDAFADLALLEQALLEVQEAEDEPAGIGPDALRALGPEGWDGARFDLARAHRILFLTHDVLPSVRAVARAERPPCPRPGSVSYLVTRQGGVARAEALDLRGAIALAALSDGASFAAACEAAGGEDAIGALVEALGVGCARGIVRGFRIAL